MAVSFYKFSVLAILLQELYSERPGEMERYLETDLDHSAQWQLASANASNEVATQLPPPLAAGLFGCGIGVAQHMVGLVKSEARKSDALNEVEAQIKDVMHGARNSCKWKIDADSANARFAPGAPEMVSTAAHNQFQARASYLDQVLAFFRVHKPKVEVAIASELLVRFVQPAWTLFLSSSVVQDYMAELHKAAFTLKGNDFIGKDVDLKEACQLRETERILRENVPPEKSDEMVSSLVGAIEPEGAPPVADEGPFDPTPEDTQTVVNLMDYWLNHTLNDAPAATPSASAQQTPAALNVDTLKTWGSNAVMSLNPKILAFHGFKQIGISVWQHSMLAATQSLASAATVAVADAGLAGNLAGAAKDIAGNVAGTAKNFAMGFGLAIIGGTSNFACKQIMKAAVPESVTQFEGIIRAQKATVDARCRRDKWFKFCDLKKPCPKEWCREGDFVRFKGHWLGKTSESKIVTSDMVKNGIVCEPSQFLGMQDWKADKWYDGGSCECLNKEFSTKYNLSPDYEAGYKAGFIDGGNAVLEAT